MSEPEGTRTPDLEALKARLKGTWTVGDFGQIARSTAHGGDDFIARLNLGPANKVLDVACGTGNLAIPAARTGAAVTGVDIAPNLLEQARTRAAAEGLNCRFDEGDAEALPYEDGSFDTVVTMFGAMFAPRPEKTAAELLRVCQSGGTIAMANWSMSGFTGQMFRLMSSYVPPPPMPAPVLWGDEETVRQRFGSGVVDLKMSRQKIHFIFPYSPKDVVNHYRTYFGPTIRSFEYLAKNHPEKQATLANELEALWASNNRATDGTVDVESEYLEVVATRV